jgi:hypothetical protein
LIETEGNFTMEEEISGAGRDRFRRRFTACWERESEKKIKREK